MIILYDLGIFVLKSPVCSEKSKCTLPFFYFQLKVNGHLYNKCLHLYEKDPKLKVDENTMRAISEKVNELVAGIIKQLADDEELAHSDYLPVNIILLFLLFRRTRYR